MKRAFTIVAVACGLVMAASILPGGAVSGLRLFEAGSSMILELRLWRLLLGATVGASLGVAGLIMQSVLRNPLADPYVLGLSAGGGLGTAFVILAGATSSALMPLGGFAGALASLGVVLLLGRSGRGAPASLLLAGVTWSALCSSVLMLLVTRFDQPGLHSVVWWFLGDLQVYHPPLAIAAAAMAVIGVGAATALTRALAILSLGDELAAYLGLSPAMLRRALLALATLLAGACVAAAGVIGFVGLVVPHAARRLVGAGHRLIVPAAALLGAAWVTGADAIGRAVAYPRELPVGILCALAGAPFFLFLLRRGAGAMWR